MKEIILYHVAQNGDAPIGKLVLGEEATRDRKSSEGIRRFVRAGMKSRTVDHAEVVRYAHSDIAVVQDHPSTLRPVPRSVRITNPGHRLRIVEYRCPVVERDRERTFADSDREVRHPWGRRDRHGADLEVWSGRIVGSGIRYGGATRRSVFDDSAPTYCRHRPCGRRECRSHRRGYGNGRRLRSGTTPATPARNNEKGHSHEGREQ